MLGFLRVIAGPVGIRWVGDEEGILLVPGGMLLGDEESVEVPEASLDISRRFSKEYALKSGRSSPVCWHLLEAHFKEDLSKLMSYFIHCRARISETRVSLPVHEQQESVQGCSAPLLVGAPIDLKLYGLKLTVFQVPLHAISFSVTLWLSWNPPTWPAYPPLNLSPL